MLTADIVMKLTLFNEFKGEQRLFIEAHKDELNELTEVAKIQSTDASNRIDGIFTADDRLKNLVLEKTTPRNRYESEIAGYRDVLNTVHESYEYIPINSNYFLQLHRDLYKFIGDADGGLFKTDENIIRERDKQGNEKIIFRPVSALEIPEALDALCDAYNDAKNDVDPLILTSMFILDFLCIHPFNDGNGRMSRLLTLLLLYQNDYIVGKYISLEKLIERTKGSYYDALQESSQGWMEDENNYEHFVKYILGIITAAYRDFFDRTKIVEEKRISKPDRIEELIKNHIGTITKTEIVKVASGISTTTVQRTLTDLVKAGKIIKIGNGRYTKYKWNWDKEI